MRLLRRWPGAGRFLAVLPVPVIVAVGGLVGAKPASAHALAVSSIPPAGATLADSPTTVTIVFSESPDPRLSSIQVLDSSGGPHQEGHSTEVAGQPDALQVSVGPLSAGVYTVNWRTVSRVDGHVATGSFAFGVRVTPAGLSATSGVVRSPPASTWAVAARWSFYLGVMGLVGLALIGWLAGPRRPLRRLRWFALTSWVLAAGGVLALEEQQRHSDGIPLGKLIGSSLGHQVLWRAVPLLVAAAGIVWMLVQRQSGGRLCLAVLGVSGLVAMFGDTEGSHVSGERSWRWFHVLTQWVHFASVGIWLGGLAVLIGVITAVDAPDRGTLVRRFSTVALLSAVAVATTGVLRGLDEIRSWHGLFDTTFGKWAILKVSLLLILLGLGWLQRARGVPGARRGTVKFLRQTGTTELAVAAVVLVAAGFLQSLAPPIATSPPRPQKPIAVSGSDFATTVRVRLQVAPGTPGFNRFTLRALDYDSLRPVVAQAVSLMFDLPSRPDLGTSTLNLSRQPNGNYSAVASNLSVSGTWTVTVLIQRASQSAEVPLTLSTRTVPVKIDVSRSPGLPTVYTIHVAPTAAFQVYLDPGKPGFNEFHVTVLAPTGNEVATSDLAVNASKGGQVASALAVRRLDSVGHFVADLPGATSGQSRFSIDATTNQGLLHADITIAVP